MEMGTGKTRTALAYCIVKKLCRILVISPLSASGVWVRESSQFWPELQVVNCTIGSTVKRAKILSRLREAASPSTCVIVGYESYWRDPLRKAILEWEPSIIIYDEAHRLKDRRTRQSKFSHTLAGVCPRRLALTGTPMPNGPEDLFSIFKAVNPSIFGTRWMDFEVQYIVKGGFQGYQIVGYRNQADIERKLTGNSFRVTKVEALDLPEQVDVQIPIILSAKARKVYDRLRTQAIVEVTGKQGSGTALSRVVLTNILRLQQVTSGFVKVVDGRIIDFASDKIDALKDLLTDVVPQAGRVVIFARFTHDIDAIVEACRSLKYPVLQLDGRVPPEEREPHIEWFRTFEPSILVGQVAVSSLGIDLSCSHVAIFYAPDYSLTNYLQSRDRLHRIGQGHKVTYYHLVADHTIDEKVYQILGRKENLMRKLLDKKRLEEFFS